MRGIQRGILRVYAAMIVVVFSAQVGASQVINFDWNIEPIDPTHVGDNGILSSAGGTVWNGLQSADAGVMSDLDDEFGNLTPVWVEHVNPFGGYTEPGPPANDLQFGGYDGDTVHIGGLLPNELYDVALYLGHNSGFQLTHGGGSPVVALGNPTYNLPGNANADYFLFTGLAPVAVPGGFGFTLSNFDGQVLGAQIEGVIPEPTSLALLGAGGVALLRRRR